MLRSFSQDGRRLSEPGAGSEAQCWVKIKDPGTRDFNPYLVLTILVGGSEHFYFSIYWE